MNLIKTVLDIVKCFLILICILIFFVLLYLFYDYVFFDSAFEQLSFWITYILLWGIVIAVIYLLQIYFMIKTLHVLNRKGDPYKFKVLLQKQKKRIDKSKKQNVKLIFKLNEATAELFIGNFNSNKIILESIDINAMPYDRKLVGLYFNNLFCSYIATEEFAKAKQLFEQHKMEMLYMPKQANASYLVQTFCIYEMYFGNEDVAYKALENLLDTVMDLLTEMDTLWRLSNLDIKRNQLELAKERLNIILSKSNKLFYKKKAEELLKSL